MRDMKTDEFINALVEDQGANIASFGFKFVAWIASGLTLSLMIFFMFLRVRADFSDLMTDPHVMFKFIFAASLLSSLLPLLVYARSPEINLLPVLRWLILPLLVLAGGVVFQLMTSRPDAWLSGMIGEHPMACLGNIPVLAIGPFIALLLILRSGAPTQPVLSGAAAGAISASLASFIYALHCPDDSALFVAVWYSLAIAIMTGFGAVMGAKWLKW